MYNTRTMESQKEKPISLQGPFVWKFSQWCLHNQTWTQAMDAIYIKTKKSYPNVIFNFNLKFQVKQHSCKQKKNHHAIVIFTQGILSQIILISKWYDGEYVILIWIDQFSYHSIWSFLYEKHFTWASYVAKLSNVFNV